MQAERSCKGPEHTACDPLRLADVPRDLLDLVMAEAGIGPSDFHTHETRAITQRDWSGWEANGQPQRVWMAPGMLIADGDSTGRFWFARIGLRLVWLRGGALVDIYPDGNRTAGPG